MLTVSFVGKKFTCDVQLEVSTTSDNDGGFNLELLVSEKSKMSKVPGPTLASLNVSIGKGRNDVTKCKEILTFLKDQALPKTLKFISINRTREQKREQQGEGLGLLNCIWPGKSRARYESVSREPNVYSEVRPARKLTGIFPAMLIEEERVGEETQLNMKNSHSVCGGDEGQLCVSCLEMLTQVHAGEAIFGTTKLRSWNEKDMLREFCEQCNDCATRGRVNTCAGHNAESPSILGQTDRDSCTKQTDQLTKEDLSQSKKVEIVLEQSPRRTSNEELVSQPIQNATDPPEKDVASLAKETVANIVSQAKTRYMLELLQEKSVDATKRDGVSTLPCQTHELVCTRMFQECNLKEHERLLSTLSESCYGTDEEQFASGKMQEMENCIYSDYKAAQSDEKFLLQEALRKLLTHDYYAQEIAYDELSLAHRMSQEDEKCRNLHFVKLFDIANRQRIDKRDTMEDTEIPSRYLSSVTVGESPEVYMARAYDPTEPLRLGQLCRYREMNSDFEQIQHNLMQSTACCSESEFFTDGSDCDAHKDSTDLRNSLVFFEDDVIPEMGASLDSGIGEGLSGCRRSIYRRTVSESQMPERKQWVPGEQDTSVPSEFEPVKFSSKRRSASCPVVTEEDIILENMESHHQDVCETLERRIWVIMNVKELWNAGKPLDAIKLCITLTGMGAAFDGRLRADCENNGADPSIKIDHVLFLNILQQLPSSCTLWTLDMCVLLLPRLRGFISTGSHTSHVEMACSILHVVIKKVHVVIRRVQKAARSPTRDRIQMIRDATSELREIKEKTRYTVQALDKCDVAHKIEDIATLKLVLRELHVALETFLNSCAVQ